MKLKITVLLLVIGSMLVGYLAGLKLSVWMELKDNFAYFAEWNPNLDQPIEQLEHVLSELEHQQPKNYTVSNVAFLYDAKLYVLFHNYLALLPASVHASQIAEQHLWMEQRKAIVHEAYMEYDGGTLASYSAGRAYITTTKERIAEIERRMKDVK